MASKRGVIPDLYFSRNVTVRQKEQLKRQWLIQYGCWDFATNAPAGSCKMWVSPNQKFIMRYSVRRSR
jgi:hypothetical protein